METKLRYRRATEAFIEDCIVHLANTIIVVVNQLQYMDQVIIQSSQKQLPENIARALYDN